MQHKQRRLKTCLQENHYIQPSYQTYGGLSGYQDFGIMGTQLKNKLLSVWRATFVGDHTDTIVEIETPIVVPYDVLNASGHVERFTDYVVYDSHNICHRADHLAKNWLKENDMGNIAEEVDTWDQQTLEFNINKYKMIQLSDSEPVIIQKKNLMFEVPSESNEHKIDFLRPELAPGIIVNFNNCKHFLQKEEQFGIAQIGTSFRKEISPQQYTRMREFRQAEIEYFVDPLNKEHPNFDVLKDTIIPLMTSSMQSNNERTLLHISIEDAVKNKLINNKLMAYFLAKIYLFAIKIGLHQDKLRFRQHMDHEMAHYALECWDLETYVNSDWLECVGCADRGSFDTQVHSKCGNEQLKSKRQLPIPITTTSLQPNFNMRLIGQQYGKMTKQITQYFNNMSQSQLQDIKNMVIDLGSPFTFSFSIGDDSFQMTKNMFTIEEISTVHTFEEYFPHILEPSFGIDRLIYSVFEQNFWSRKNDDQRIVLSLPFSLSPYSVGIFSLVKTESLNTVVKSIFETLSKNGFKCFLDNSSTKIGKRYVRADEMGIKYVITVDFDSLEDKQVTIRERDEMTQIRVNIDDLLENINKN